MVNSVSWQHEPNPTMLFSAWVGKMELSCLLLRACPLCPARNIFPESHIQYDKSFIDWACLVKMTRYWLCSFSPNFMDLGSVSVHIHAKKKTPLANIQRSWTHAWSITHISGPLSHQLSLECNLVIFLSHSWRKELQSWGSKQCELIS